MDSPVSQSRQPRPGCRAAPWCRGKWIAVRTDVVEVGELRALQARLEERPKTASDRVFLNWRRKPITISGTQYRLKQHCQAAGVKVSCHELRHTFARRLVEAGLPVDSLSKLHGHSHLHTTRRYIDGALRLGPTCATIPQNPPVSSIMSP